MRGIVAVSLLVLAAPHAAAQPVPAASAEAALVAVAPPAFPVAPDGGPVNVRRLRVLWRPPEAASAVDAAVGAARLPFPSLRPEVAGQSVLLAEPPAPRALNLGPGDLVVTALDSSGTVVSTVSVRDPALRGGAWSDSGGAAVGSAWLSEASLSFDVPISAVELRFYRPTVGASGGVVLRAAGRAAVPGIVGDGAASVSSAYPVHLVRGDNVPRSNRIDIALLPEAFTSADFGCTSGDRCWPAQAAAVADYLLSLEPFRTFRGYFNFWRVDLPSNASFIGRFGTANDTFFGLFRHGGAMTSYEGYNGNALTAVLDAFGNAGFTLDSYMIIESETGSGSAWQGSLIVGPRSPRTVLAYALGRTFGRLGHEHGREACGPCSGTLTHPNVSCHAAVNDAPWNGWAGREGVPVAGALNFVGADYCADGRYRATADSLMRSPFKAEAVFGPVNREELVRQIYSVVSPVDSKQPQGNKVVPVGCGPVSFSVATVSPLGENSVEIAWTVGAESQLSAADSTDFALTHPCSLEPGDHQVKAVVRHSTPFVLPGRSSDLLEDSAEWTLTVPDTAPTNVVATALRAAVRVEWTPGRAAAEEYGHLVNYGPVLSDGSCAGALVHASPASGPLLPTHASSHLVPGLQPGTEYCFGVGAYRAQNDAAWSAPPAARATPLEPAAPTGVSAVSAGAGAVTVSWTNNAHGLKHLVNFGPRNGGDCAAVPTPSSSPGGSAVDGRIQPGVSVHEVAGLTPGTEYCFAVGAYRGDHDAMWSARSVGTAG